MKPAMRSIRKFSSFFITLVTVLLMPCSSAIAQNGITANESATTISGGSGFDALWADSHALRWMVNNHNAGGQALSVWACPTQTGGIVYSGSPGASTINSEACLSLGAAAGIPLLAGSSAPQWGGTYLDLQTNPIVTEIQNNSAGTTLNKLVILVNASGAAQVETALTSTTLGVEGICVAGCGTSGTAQIAREGVASCVFDGSTTAGDYVQISTTAGDCHDTGSSTTYPSNGNQVLGRVLSTQSSGGTPYSMVLYASGTVPPNQGSACSNKVVTALSNASGPTCTTITSAYVDSSVAPTASPSLTGTPTAPTAASTTNTTQVATTAFVKSAVFLTWGSAAPGTLNSAGSFGQWTTPAAINGTFLDVALITAPTSCSNYGTFQIYDNTASSVVLSVNFSNGAATYTASGTVAVASGHVLRAKLSTAASGCTQYPLNALITFTYQMQ